MRSLKDYMVLVLKGMGMGAADVVPGVSGGTIAFITGIYEELINSIKSITPHNLLLLFRKGGLRLFAEAVNLRFLVCVVLGVGISFLSLAKLMKYLLANHPVLIWAFFFGLILASAWYVAKTVPRWGWLTALCCTLGAASGYLITVSTPAQTPETLWFICLSGAIAIVAMILPGISGSFILLLLGKYHFMMNAIADLQLPVIAVFAIGAAIGLIAFSHALSWLLKHHKGLTVALLTGFMLGSLNKVWPWKVVQQTITDAHGNVRPLVEANVLPSTYELHTQQPAQLGWAIALMLLGLAVIIAIERLALRNEAPVSEK